MSAERDPRSRHGSQGAAPGRLAVLEADGFADRIQGGSTRLRFDPYFHSISPLSNWRSGRRVLDTHLLNFVPQGEGWVECEGRTHPFRAGAFIWFSPGAAHEVVFNPAMRHYMKFALWSGASQYRLRDDFVIVENAWELAYFSEQILRELNQELPLRDLRCRAMLTMLFTSMQRKRRQAARGARLLNRAQQRRLRRFVSRNVHRGLSAADLAGAVELSLDYFSRVFKQTYGLSPREWLLRERMRLAVGRMATTDHTLQQIAFQLGYHYPYLFSRQFKQVFGMSPRAYRRQHAELAR
ncbi:MAG: helix-turn-helix domain-containing protein [Kiritimatiellae bacterium]|nr:helix-turn-helix domain-containing protein [Kiritimatiellia bacterium]